MSDLFISWLPQKKIPYLPILFAPPQAVETFSAKTSRRISKTESARADTLREINSDVIRAKLVRKVANAEKVPADTFTKIVALENFSADTKIQLGIKEKIHGDTFLQVALSQKVQSDLNRALPEFSHADALRKIVRVEKTPADTIIRVPHVLNYVVTPRLLSKKKLTAAESPSLVNTFKNYGVTSINITLNEKTLSDDFRLETCRQMEVNDAVQGSLLDYHFNFLVEETEQTELVQTVKGRYNQDDLLYTQFFLPTAEIEGKETADLKTAREFIADVASAAGLGLITKFDNFTPYGLTGGHRITYADLASSLFGWTSRVPQRQINIFIRGGVLHCIQRGKESSVFDITDLPHSRPAVNKKFIRSLWSNPKPEDETSDPNPKPEDGTSDPLIEYMFDEYSVPFSGTIEFDGDSSIAKLTYKNGLLYSEYNSTSNSSLSTRSSVYYSYIEIFPAMSELQVFFKTMADKNFHGDFYLSKKRTHVETIRRNDEGTEKVIQYGTTTFHYKSMSSGDVYLFAERDSNTTENYEFDTKKGVWVLTDKKNDLRETYHYPLGNGWYAQSTYLNGECQGSNLSQGKPGNAVSQYTFEETQKILKGITITYNNNDDDNDSAHKDTPSYEDWRRKLSPIMDISFPVKEYNIVKELTDALLWLNRKTEETVSLDLISPVENGIPKINHIIDFTERIRFNGNDYFLISNHISFTPRKFIQKLQLVRWY